MDSASTLLIVFVAATSCAAPAVTVAKTASVIAPPQAPSPAEAADAPPPRASLPNRCLPDGLPPAKKVKAERDQSSCVDHRKVEAKLAPQIAKNYSKRQPKGIVEVQFGCDPLLGPVREVWVEVGSGHGGSLQLWRLSRDDGAGAFDVLAVANETHFQSKVRVAGQPATLVARGSLPASVLEAALTTARPAMTARVRELRPPPQAGLGLSGFGSSGNFHHFLSVADEFDNALSHQFTGYPGSGGQHRYLGLQLAMDALLPLLRTFEFKAEARSPELVDWFSTRATRAWPRLQDSSAWWVRERIVLLGGKIGDRRLVPLILQQLEHGLGQITESKPEDVENITGRYLTDPLTALTRITGWDARLDDTGTAVPLARAARSAISECRAGMPANAPSPP